MDEKLIIELDNDKIKYAVFKTNEDRDYELLTNKISKNVRIKKGKIFDFEYSSKIINEDLYEIEKNVNKIFKSITVILNQRCILYKSMRF